MSGTDETIMLADGRRLGFARYGDEGGAPAMFMHGFPASRLEAALWDGASLRAGVRLIAPDRPGFGLSDPAPERRVTDWPTDAAALADALGIGRLRLIGGSAGCPYALAFAHAAPERIAAVATVGGIGPAGEREAARRMGAPARLAFVLARRAPPLFRLAYGGLARVIARWPELNQRLTPPAPPDRAVMARPEVEKILDAALREAFRGGVGGALDELALLARPWGFGIGDVAPPVRVWHGTEDGVVPPAFAEIIAGRAPRGTLRLVEGEGHVSLAARRGEEILRDLVEAG